MYRYAACFDANAGIFEVLLTPDDAVFSDELNHASIIDGIRLCKAQKARYKHRDMADLERQLIEKKDARIKVIATDGVFSMDGTVAPLEEICDLADKHGAIVFVDEVCRVVSGIYQIIDCFLLFELMYIVIRRVLSCCAVVALRWTALELSDRVGKTVSRAHLLNCFMVIVDLDHQHSSL